VVLSTLWHYRAPTRPGGFLLSSRRCPSLVPQRRAQRRATIVEPLHPARQHALWPTLTEKPTDELALLHRGSTTNSGPMSPSRSRPHWMRRSCTHGLTPSMTHRAPCHRQLSPYPPLASTANHQPHRPLKLWVRSGVVGGLRQRPDGRHEEPDVGRDCAAA
jgi:hypothetical protein